MSRNLELLVGYTPRTSSSGTCSTTCACAKRDTLSPLSAVKRAPKVLETQKHVITLEDSLVV